MPPPNTTVTTPQPGTRFVVGPRCHTFGVEAAASSGGEFVGQADLRWWLDLAPRLEWIFAKTYAETAPHSYVVLGRSPGLTREDYVRAGRVIRTFGEPGKYYRSTNLYLYSEDRQYKYWAMWGDPPQDEDAELINCATTERVYGAQEWFDMPRLRSLMLPPEEEMVVDHCQ